MSQHDMNVANADGATVRADLNNALGALVTLSSGATAPSTTFAHMLWVDTTSGTVKRRNAANTGWIIERTIDETRVVSRSANTILDESDIGKTIVATANFTQTFTAAATLGDGWWIAFVLQNDVGMTFDPNSSETIDGATTKVARGPCGGIIYCDGSAFYTIGFPNSDWPEFLAHNSATDANQTGNGATATVDFDTEVFDTSSDFASDTFTAPVTGKYLLATTVRANGISTAMTLFTLTLTTSNRDYNYVSSMNWAATAQFAGTIVVVADMDAADTASVNLTIANGAGNTAGIVGGASPYPTYFSGRRLV